MSENKDRYHDTVLDLEAKLKKNVDLILMLSNSLQGMFMLGPKPLNSEIPWDVRDTEDTLDDASKSQQKMQEKMNDPIISKATPYSPVQMPSELPLIKQLDKMKRCFHTFFELIQKNCKRESIFFTSPEEIRLNEFCQDQVNPIVNDLKFYFEDFRKLFQTDIKDMKDVFKSIESELCDIKKQNDFLQDQFLEASIRHDVEISVLLNHECVEKSLHGELEHIKKNSIEIQEGLKTKIKILENDVQRCQKQSVDFRLKLQHEKEKHKWELTLKSTNINPLDYSWISKMEKLLKTRLEIAEKEKPVTLQTSPDKQRGANSNKNVLAPRMYKVVTTQESQLNEAKHGLSSTGMNDASSVRRPMNRDSHIKNSVLANSKNSTKRVGVYVRKNKQPNNTSKNVFSNNDNVIDVDVAKAPKAKTLLYTTYVVLKTRFSEKITQSKPLDTTSIVSKSKIDVGRTSTAKSKVVQIVLWIVDSGCSKYIVTPPNGAWTEYVSEGVTSS
ncbi:hypothetical protein Tco_1546795 [Tanacetum coccineum]